MYCGNVICYPFDYKEIIEEFRKKVKIDENLNCKYLKNKFSKD